MDIYWTTIEMTDFKKKEKEVKERTSPTLCCPDVLSTKIYYYQHISDNICPTPNCLKKIVPWDIKVVKCPSCGNRSLTRKLNAFLIGVINLDHKEKTYQLTVFPETINFQNQKLLKNIWAKRRKPLILESWNYVIYM